MPSPYALVVNGHVLYDPHEGKQQEALRRLRARAVGTGAAPANLFLWGNRGGGKSRLVRSFFHAMAMTFPGLKYVIVRRNYPDLNKNHLIYVGAEMRRMGGHYNRADHQANYHNGSIGFYFQCEEEGDVEKVVGAEAALLFVDEAPQIEWDYLRMMGPSLRVPITDGQRAPYRTLTVYGGNPTGESIDLIWSYFIDKDVDRDGDPEYFPEDFDSLEVRLEDNPSLDPLEYRRQFAGLPEHIRAAWLDGVRMESRTLFKVQKTKDGKPYHYIQELPTVDGEPLLKVPWVQVYRAFDMGFYPDPAICLWFVVLGRRVLVVHEGTWFNTIAKDLAAIILRETKELFGRDVQTITYADPSIAYKQGHDTVTIADTLEMNGVPIECSINDRILYADAIHGLLGEELSPGVPRLQIYEPGCPMLCRYLPKMRWDETNLRKMANHRSDHWPVALAYFAISSGVLTFSEATTHAPEPIWKEWIRESQRARMRRAFR